MFYQLSVISKQLSFLSLLYTDKCSMINAYCLLLTVYCSLLTENCYAQFNSELQRAYTEIRELRINAGRQILAKEKARNISSEGFTPILFQY
jgi:hypothetical protein